MPKLSLYILTLRHKGKNPMPSVSISANISSDL